MKVAMVLAVLIGLPQDPPKPEKVETAEELFKRFEKKFEEAKSISVKFKTETFEEVATDEIPDKDFSIE